MQQHKHEILHLKNPKMKMEMREELTSVSVFCKPKTVQQLCSAKSKTIETHQILRHTLNKNLQGERTLTGISWFFSAILTMEGQSSDGLCLMDRGEEVLWRWCQGKIETGLAGEQFGEGNLGFLACQIDLQPFWRLFTGESLVVRER